MMEQHQELASADATPCPICGKPCPPDESVKDAHGLFVHKKCYRSALIEGRELL